MGNTDRVYRQGDTFWGEKKGRELFLGEKKRGIFFFLKGIVRRIFINHELRRGHLGEENPFYRN